MRSKTKSFKGVVNLFILLNFLCISCTTVPKFISQDEVLKLTNRKSLPNKAEFPGADAAILYSYEELRLELEDKEIRTYITKHVFKQVFSDFHEQSYIDIPIDFDESLVDVQARTIKQDGTIKVMTEEDLVIGTFKSNTEQKDTKLIKCTFKGIEENTLIEYIYTIENRSGLFRHEWILNDMHAPILFAKYKLINPNKIEFSEWRVQKSIYSRLFNVLVGFFLPGLMWDVHLNDSIGSSKPMETNDDKHRYAEWIFRDIPQFKPEPNMPPYSSYISRIVLTPDEIGSWNRLSKMYYKHYFLKNLDFDQTVYDKALEITKNCSTEIEKIIAVKDYVQSIRSDGHRFGEGGIVPLSPKLVIDKEYGDCKDKTALAFTLLTYLKIESYPAVLLTTNEGKINPDFPSWQFNHMILLVRTKSGAGFWIDPTVNYCKLGDVPWTDQGADALVIKDDGDSFIKKIPESNILNNSIMIHVKLKVSNEGNGNFDITMRFTGEEDLFVRNMITELNFEEVHELFKSMIFNEFMDSDIQNLEFSQLPDINESFTAHFTFNADNVIEKQGDISFLKFNPTKLVQNLEWLMSNERRYPIYYQYPCLKKKEIEIELPPDKFKLVQLPSDYQKECDDFTYSKKALKTDDTHIIFHEEFGVKSSIIDSKKFNDLKKFFNEIVSKMNERVILTKK